MGLNLYNSSISVAESIAGSLSRCKVHLQFEGMNLSFIDIQSIRNQPY